MFMGFAEAYMTIAVVALSLFFLPVIVHCSVQSSFSRLAKAIVYHGLLFGTPAFLVEVWGQRGFRLEVRTFLELPFRFSVMVTGVLTAIALVVSTIAYACREVCRTFLSDETEEERSPAGNQVAQPIRAAVVAFSPVVFILALTLVVGLFIRGIRRRAAVHSWQVPHSALGEVSKSPGSARANQGSPRSEAPRYTQLPFPGARQLALLVDQPQVIDDYELEIELKGAGEEDGRHFADVELNYSKRSGYNGRRSVIVGSGAGPNAMGRGKFPGLDLLAQAKVLYRTVRHCDGQPVNTAKNGAEIIQLLGYRAYRCLNRFHEQCIAGGSSDQFYDERCDYGLVRLSAGEEKRSSEFSIRLDSVDLRSATVSLSYVGPGRYEPGDTPPATP
jgi:hypothetical protein